MFPLADASTFTALGLTGPIAGVVGLMFAAYLATKIMAFSEGSEQMRKIAKAIQDGAKAFLFTEYKWLALYVAVVGGLLWALHEQHGAIAISFVCGAAASALAGYIGMTIATRAAVRTTEAAKTSLQQALTVSFSSGAVMGLCVVGLGVIGLSGLYFGMTKGMGREPMEALQAIFGFSLGASSIALFARVGGGIFTKAADVGADLVGKVEAGIPEDDPRNPAVIADNVGDNVGDVAQGPAVRLRRGGHRLGPRQRGRRPPRGPPPPGPGRDRDHRLHDRHLLREGRQGGGALPRAAQRPLARLGDLPRGRLLRHQGLRLQGR
jgi:K(+)-stimulated pyrophosphate-energized sodium pump